MCGGGDPAWTTGLELSTHCGRTQIEKAAVQQFPGFANFSQIRPQRSRSSAAMWEVEAFHQFIRKGKSMAIVYLGIDLAKSVFAQHGVDESGKPAQVRRPRKKTSTDEPLERLQNLGRFTYLIREQRSSI